MRARLAAAAALALLLAGFAAAAPPTAPASAAPPSTAPREARRAPAAVSAVATIGLVVGDLDRSVEFFTKVLTFGKVQDAEVAGEAYERLEGVFALRMRVARLRLGEESIELIEFLAPRGRPVPADSRGNDRWFQHIAIVTGDMDRAYARLRDNRVEHLSPSPQRLPDWNRNAGGIRAFYFKDPDGHPLELIQFPAGKGDPRWQRPTDRLFLGIDHTAIVVGNTERSLGAYRDGLGLRVAGESENYGPEQERLNGVFGDRLRITALRAPSGPGIEFLEYLAPRDGRPAPPDARTNDLVAWRTTLVATDLEASARDLRRAGFEWVSPGAVLLPGRELGCGEGLLLRDPDGHLVRLVGSVTR